MACSVPILLLAFNRPGQTKKVLEQIRQAAPPRLYAHCDGPRPGVAADVEKTTRVQEAIEAFGQDTGIEVLTLFRTENKGLRKGVYEALNWFFEQEEYGIILEDDCVPDPSMFPFCEELLIKYKDDPEIMHIGCSNLAEIYTKELAASYVFSKFSFVWGWASWRRAWAAMDFNLEGLAEFERSGAIKRFVDNPMAQTYMLDKFQATKQGRLNSWAYAWFYSILKTNGLCIVSAVNLIQNVGIGEEGATNTRGRNESARRRAQAVQFPLVHPGNRLPAPGLETRFFYTSQKRRLRLILWYILHLIGLR